MNKPVTLEIFAESQRVGRLDFDAEGERFEFLYAAAWQSNPEAWPISPSFPLHGAAPNSGSVRRYLENLLPEGRALDVVLSATRLARAIVFGLIRELGRDVAGALSFLPAGTTPEEAKAVRRELAREELGLRLEARPHQPLAVWDGKLRLSLAGAQEKLAVRVDGERLYLVDGALATTHLIKPESGDGSLPGLVANEHYCMSLAVRLGLEAPAVSILRLPHPVLLVERFDRIRSGDDVRRLHAIDACQALDLPCAYKYERNFGSGADVREVREGVSFERLFALSDATGQKALTRRTLTRWALFQFLIGNSDAHGKNVTFFSRPSGLALAPFYDLVSVAQYPEFEHDLAMAFGDEFKLAEVTPFDLADFAKRCGLDPGFLGREMLRLARAAESEAPRQSDDPSYVGDEKVLVQQIARFVTEQAKRLRSMVRPMREVAAL
jgi:serine/threonine-protein kinase HipA